MNKWKTDTQIAIEWLVTAALIFGSAVAFNILSPSKQPDEGITTLFVLVGGGIFVAKIWGDSMSYERQKMEGYVERHSIGAQIAALAFGAIALWLAFTVSKTP